MIRSICILTLLCISFVCVVCADRIGQSRLYDTTGRKLQTLGRVERLVLINAITDLPIVNLTNNAVINVATLPTSSFNIQATTNGVVGSIRFGYNSNMNYEVQSTQPFSFCGDKGGNYKICSVLAIGRHVVTATPFSNASATGLAGTPFRVTFNVTNITSTTAPTNSPTKAPSCVIPQFVGDWESVGPKYPFSTDEAEGLIIGNDLVQFSGYTQRFASATNSTYAKDITIPGSAWRRMGNVPVEVALTHVASVLIGTKVYLCGGYTGISGGRHSPDCFVYDHSLPPGPGQWSTTAIPSLPHGGTGGAGMIYDAASNSLFYTGGAQRFSLGSKEATDLPNTFKYSFSDPSVGWVPSTPLPYTGNHLSYVTHRLGGQERHFFLAGQETECERNVSRSDHFEFIASNETWIRRASLPFGRGHMSASTRAIGCGFLIVGGSINSSPPYRVYTRTNDVSYYDIPTNTWTSIGTVPTEEATPIADIHPDGYMYYTDDTLRRRKINTGI